ncbi:hypothetical protein GCM10022222_76840 [Amycolatopsis ultiminotia]|uniref:Uncharacterized protein n=1 Tax=Amycolatopsis ultiminotia TaxID=543629 RepID=A0ABP6YE87_9PSEU
MPEEAGGPALGPTLDEWLKAREETRAHLGTRPAAASQEWAQRLADLLATETSWQAQYTELIGRDIPPRRFPTSNR